MGFVLLCDSILLYTLTLIDQKSSWFYFTLNIEYTLRIVLKSKFALLLYFTLYIKCLKI